MSFGIRHTRYGSGQPEPMLMIFMTIMAVIILVICICALVLSWQEARTVWDYVLSLMFVPLTILACCLVGVGTYTAAEDWREKKDEPVDDIGESDE